MDQINFIKIGKLHECLTNQIFNSITGILSGYQNNKKITIVDNLLSDYSKINSLISLSDVFDMEKTNNYLYNKFGTVIFDKNTIVFKLIKVNYGHKEKIYDITDKIQSIFYKNNTLHIPKETDLNSLSGDPCFGFFKTMTMYYSLNGYDFVTSFNEHFYEDIIFNPLIAKYYQLNELINKFDFSMFDDILCNIYFNNTFKNIDNEFLKNVEKNEKINVIHLTLEDEGLKHLCIKNNMSMHEYKKCIENKYISLINSHVNKNDINIILSHQTKNRVIDFMKSNNYKCLNIKNNNNAYEIKSIIDLLVSGVCNNIYFGNYNIYGLNGCSFSYYVSKKMSSSVKQILIDPDNIMTQCIVHFNF